MKKIKNIMHKNTLIIGLLCIALIAMLGSTFAFYNSTHTIDNFLVTSGNGETYIEEVFNKDDKWLPGETKTKEVLFGNKSEVDQVMRFRYEVVWLDKNGSAWTPPALEGDEAPVEVHLTDAVASEYTKITTDGTDWYYYNTVLAAATSAAAGTETNNVIDYVKFSPLLSNGTDPDNSDFSDKNCQVNVYMETLDVNGEIINANWSVTMTQSGTNLTWAE